MRRTWRTWLTRRTWRTWRTSLAVALSAGLLSAVAACAIGGADAGAADPSASNPVTRILGTWMPVEIPGYVVPPGFPNAFALATITFDGKGHWHGSDGCNQLLGTYRVGVDGVISTTSSPTTLIGCANVPNARVLHAATHAHIIDGGLVLTDKADEIVGRYQHIANTTIGPPPT
jgi:hypothetical protein